jgi:hypothetical protein
LRASVIFRLFTLCAPSYSFLPSVSFLLTRPPDWHKNQAGLLTSALNRATPPATPASALAAALDAEKPSTPVPAAVPAASVAADRDSRDSEPLIDSEVFRIANGMASHDEYEPLEAGGLQPHLPGWAEEEGEGGSLRRGSALVAAALAPAPASTLPSAVRA